MRQIIVQQVEIEGTFVKKVSSKDRFEALINNEVIQMLQYIS